MRFTTHASVIVGFALVALLGACGSNGVYNNTGNRAAVTDGDGSGNGDTGNAASAGNSSPTAPSDNGELIDFGGMYGYGWANGASFYYPNPITNAPTCPVGYTAVGVLGTANLDYGVAFCYRQHQAGRQPDYDFGGAYGYTTGSTVYANPVTGGASCPTGYTAATVLGTAGLDWPIAFCYRPHVAGVAEAAKFGGMFGYNGANGMTNVNVNPLTNGATCPSGYRQTQIFGTGGLDYPVFLCTL